MRDAKGRFCKALKFKVGDVVDAKWCGWTCIGGVVNDLLHEFHDTPYWVEGDWKHIDGTTCNGMSWWCSSGNVKPHIQSVPQSVTPKPTITHGSVVTLLSGGPSMTVDQIHDKSITVCWISGGIMRWDDVAITSVRLA